MMYTTLKALHLIGIVSWFAGLFYLVRLFIYHVEALARPESERRVLISQFALMERRLWYGITVPAMALTTLCGLGLAALMSSWSQPWFHSKMVFLILLFAYHWNCGRIRRRLLDGVCGATSRGLRVLNEVATVLLVAIVFVAVSRDPGAWVTAVLGFLLIAALILIVLRLRKREK